MSRVLFVDDEALILNSLKRGLMDEPYEKFFATSGEDALRIMETHTIGVLVTDMKMPGMSGLELLKTVKERYPDMIKLVLSGYTQLPQVLVTVNQGDIFKFITKPWDLEEELKGIIREAVDYYNYRLEMRKAREALEKKNVTFQNILKTYDDKLLSMRDEMVHMRSMNNRLNKEVLRKINRWDPKTDNKEALIEAVAKCQGLLMEAYDLLPVQTKRFNGKQVLDDMRRHVADSGMLTHVEFNMDSNLKAVVKGRYDVLFFVLKKILALLVVDAFDAQVSLLVSGAEKSETEFIFKTVLKVEDKWFLKGPAAESDFLWLSQLMSGFGGELLMKEIGPHKVLILDMTCEI